MHLPVVTRSVSSDNLNAPAIVLGREAASMGFQETRADERPAAVHASSEKAAKIQNDDGDQNESDSGEKELAGAVTRPFPLSRH